MERICQTCRHRGSGGYPGCGLARQVQPNPTEQCPFKPSRWESKSEPQKGRYITGYEVDPSPRLGVKKGEPGDTDEGYSTVSMGGSLYLVKDGSVYHPESKEILGDLEIFELDSTLRQLGYSRETVPAKLLDLIKENPDVDFSQFKEK